jgi:hypothetical protein
MRVGAREWLEHEARDAEWRRRPGRPLISEGSWEWRAVVYVRTRLHDRVDMLSAALGPHMQVLAALRRNKDADPAALQDLRAAERLAAGIFLVILRDAELLQTVSDEHAHDRTMLRASITALRHLHDLADASPHLHAPFLAAVLRCHPALPPDSPLLPALRAWAIRRIDAYLLVEPDADQKAPFVALRSAWTT